MQLLDLLRQLGFTVDAVGDQVRVRHPSHEVPQEAIPLLVQLRPRKTEVLEALVARSAFIDALLRMPLSHFEREGHPIEIAVPWFEETLWFVPGEREVHDLALKQVSRGRVWTARELIELHQLPALDEESVKTIALAKIEFQGRVLEGCPQEDRPGAIPPQAGTDDDSVPPVRDGGKDMEAEMALKFKAGSGKPAAPDGTYSATLTKVEERENDNGPFLIWSFEMSLNGTKRTVSGVTSSYFTEKAKARQWTEAILGRSLGKDEEVDLEALYGRPCQVVVKVKQIDGGRTVNRVESVEPQAEDSPF